MSKCTVGAVYDRTFLRAQLDRARNGFCLAPLILLLSACSTESRNPESSEEISTVRVAVGGQAQYVYLPLTLADKLGYFAEEGLEVEISDLRGGS